MSERELLVAFLDWLAHSDDMAFGGVSFCGTGYAGEQLEFGMNHADAVDKFLATRHDK